MKYEQLVRIFLQEKPTVIYLIISLAKTDSEQVRQGCFPCSHFITRMARLPVTSCRKQTLPPTSHVPLDVSGNSRMGWTGILQGEYFEFGRDVTTYTICRLGNILLKKKKKLGFVGLCCEQEEQGCVCPKAEPVRSLLPLLSSTETMGLINVLCPHAQACFGCMWNKKLGILWCLQIHIWECI